jgi:heme/copper-type cytochrome/quinol oxidase subunit 4
MIETQPPFLSEQQLGRAPGDRPTVAEEEKSSGVLVYTVGLLLAVILTATSFWVANTSLLWGPGVHLGLVVLAIAQMGVHLVFFLHIGTGPDSTNNGRSEQQHDAASRADGHAHAALSDPIPDDRRPMTPQDTQMLQDFLNQLTRAQIATKDPEAEILIARAFAQQPDAAYLVVQRALLLEQALKRAEAQIAQFQQKSSSFVGTRAWNVEPRPAPGAAPASAEPLPPRAVPHSPEAGGPWSSFLGNAAATAAGVAGGAFLFHGLENLFGHGDGLSGANAPAEMVENVTVNYYGGDDDSTDLAASDSADDALDPGAGDSGDDASWT